MNETACLIIKSLQEITAVIRRKLFAYTAMFTAGISAGFFIFEKARLAGGMLLMVTAAVSVFAFPESGCCLIAPGHKEDVAMKQAAKTVGNRHTAEPALKLIAALAAGFLIFTLRFISYGTAMPDSGRDADGSGEERTGIEGMVQSVTVKDGGLRIVLCDTDAVREGIRVMVILREPGDTDPGDVIGRRISAYGTLRSPQGADNPGCFDYRTYLRSRGIGCYFSAKAVDVLNEEDEQSGAGGAARRLYYRYLRRLYFEREAFLDRFTDEEVRAFVKGTVFGDKSDIDEEVRDDFTENGTGHILAVSGLHTGFLYALLKLLTGRRKSIVSAAAVIAVLIMYGDMTMWSPATVRAVTVLSVSIISLYARRPFDLLTSVSAAALLILIREPYQLFSAGFQMSFLALLGIAFLAGPVSHFTGDAMAVMLSVQAGILPLSTYIFHRLNFLSIFINIPVIFLASILVPACMLMLFISFAAGTVPGIMVTAAEGLAWIVVKLNAALSADGYFSGLITSAGAGILVLLYLTVFAGASEWCRVMILRREYVRIAAAGICILAVSLSAELATYNQFADDEIVFVSVGQGDCTHIRAGGKDVLIDGGGSTERNTGKDVLMPYLLANGAERTEFALVTHLHTDHFLGITELSQIYPVGAVGIPSDYMKSVEKSRGVLSHLPEGIEYIYPESTVKITDSVYAETLWPLRGASGDIDMDDPNEHNMVYMIHYGTGHGEIRVMVTGDLLEEDELKMVETYRGTDALKCDILKVAHHGSRSSSSEEFLDAADPSAAVIQVGKNNFYGHPHQQTLDRLTERGIRVYRTDINGAVGIDIRCSGLKIDVMDQQER